MKKKKESKILKSKLKGQIHIKNGLYCKSWDDEPLHKELNKWLKSYYIIYHKNS